MLNFAIIGCGHIGKRHARQCAAWGRLIAVCDIDPARAEQLGSEYDARSYSSSEGLLDAEKEIDVVAVCTPNGLHPAHTIQALKAGAHVICEKPMAIRVTDCERMIAESVRVKKQLFVVKQNRFNPPVAAVKKMLDEHELGRIFSLQLNCCWHRGGDYYRDSWHGSMELDGGILYTQFSHFIDLLQWMVGDVRESKGYSANFAHGPATAFEDTVAASLLFENGTIASLHCSTNSYGKNMEGSLTIIAEKGTVRIGGAYLNQLDYLHSLSGLTVALPAGNVPNDYGAYQGSMSNHDKIYQHVVDVITGGQANQFNGLGGLKTVKIIEKIYSAVR
jgi:UDP-N-acetyl-2-amino-2-deoxyglucuronate dehydrogenase